MEVTWNNSLGKLVYLGLFDVHTVTIIIIIIIIFFFACFFVVYVDRVFENLKKKIYFFQRF